MTSDPRVSTAIIVELTGSLEELFRGMKVEPTEASYLLVWDAEDIRIPWTPGQTAREAILAWAREQ